MKLEREYDIVIGEKSTEDFIRVVKAYLSQGWELVGGGAVRRDERRQLLDADRHAATRAAKRVRLVTRPGLKEIATKVGLGQSWCSRKAGRG